MYISCETEMLRLNNGAGCQLLLLLTEDGVFPTQSSPYVLQNVQADAKLEI